MLGVCSIKHDHHWHMNLITTLETWLDLSPGFSLHGPQWITSESKNNEIPSISQPLLSHLSW